MKMKQNEKKVKSKKLGWMTWEMSKLISSNKKKPILEIIN